MSSDFSDATIRCGQSQFPVHRVILSAQSEFFEKAFLGPWKVSPSYEWGAVIHFWQESVDRVITLQLIRFMYTLDYKYCHIAGNNTAAGSISVEAITFHARLYSYGEKYLIPDLKQVAWEKCMVELYQLLPPAIDVDGFDKFPEAITEIYSSTPENDCGLRDLMASHCSAHLTELLEKEGFLNALTIPGFSADVMRHSETEKNRRQKKNWGVNTDVRTKNGHRGIGWRWVSDKSHWSQRDKLEIVGSTKVHSQWYDIGNRDNIQNRDYMRIRNRNRNAWIGTL